MALFQQLKAEQNRGYRKLLLKTGTATLLEYDRHAALTRRPPLWGGKVINGSIYGTNLAGGILEDARKLCQDLAKADAAALS